LAAVVISSIIRLLEFKDLRRIYRIQRWEFWLSMVCLVGVVILGTIPGIAIAVVIAVIEFLWDGWRRHFAVLGRVDGIRGYPDALLVPGRYSSLGCAPLLCERSAIPAMRAGGRRKLSYSRSASDCRRRTRDGRGRHISGYARCIESNSRCLANRTVFCRD